MMQNTVTETLQIPREAPGSLDSGKPCVQIPEAPKPSLIGRCVVDAFYNAFQIFLGELKQEPRTLLHLGGARQLLMAQQLALLLPFTKIYIVDPDPEVTAWAQSMVRCRLHFATAPIEALPFENDEIDLTIGHNIFQVANDWTGAMREIGRVTGRDFVFSTHRPKIWALMKRLPGVPEALSYQGLTPPEDKLPPDWMMLWHRVNHAGKLVQKASPWPFNMYRAVMKSPDIQSERLILEP
jgi:hypothetical protein